jgi:putative glutamine amidotransferase
MQPIIGITMGFERTEGPTSRLRSYLNAAYSDSIWAAGGTPFPIPPAPRPTPQVLNELLDRCDGLLFTGGPDLNPRHYGQSKHDRTEVLHDRRDAFDIALFRRADERQEPLLAICLGCQIASVARGGCLVQHIDDLPRRGAVEHHKPDHTAAYHPVTVERDSRLFSIVKRAEFEVNSRHHQIVDREQLGGRLRPVAFAPDGVVEAAEDAGDRFMIAVQWHPEDMIDRPEHLALFQALVEEAGRRRGTISPR